MYGGRIEQSPKADEPLQRLNEPLQERLLRAMDFYEKSCRKEEIRVIATVRNEKEREFPDEPSEWEKLEFEKYPTLWQRFAIYELPEPEEAAIIGVLRETVPQANIQANCDDYPRFAQRNDHTFSNIVENIRSARNNNQPLGLDTFRDTLKGTWEKRYQEVVKKYPIAPYIYDAVELLETMEITLSPCTVKPTALLIADVNLLRRLKNWLQIRNAWGYLIGKERILEPREGQIEAKGRRVELSKYISPLYRLVLKLAAKHPSKMLVSLIFFTAKALESGHYKEALTSFNKTLEITSNLYQAGFDKEYVLEKLKGSAYSGKGFALDNLGRHEEAIASYDKALELKPDNYETWNNRGSALRDLGRDEEALISFDKALELKPDYHIAWHGRGNALLNLGRLNEVLTSYDKAIHIKPDFHEVWNNRGIALLNLGHLDEALADYDKALNIKPDYHQAWNNRGNALLNLGRHEEALVCFDKALELKPDSYEAWNNRGIVLLKVGCHEEALVCFDKARQIKPSLHQAWNNRGIVLRKLRRINQAIASCNKALKIKPDYYEAWYNRGIALGMLGRLNQGIASFEQATQIKPDFHDAWYIQGMGFSALGRLEEAIASYDKALEIQPNDANTFYGKACCYALQGNVDLAIENLQQAINLNPDKYREIAKTESDFDSIREDNRFHALIQDDTH
jgi:tetratricopeptide (TPR) repeat protein